MISKCTLVLLMAATSAIAVKVHNIHCISEVQARFAITDFTSVIEADNQWVQQEEVTYDVVLPERAFISSFSVKMDGVITHGEIKEKEQARIEYEEAKRNGKAAGHIAQAADALPREAKKFQVKVSVPKGKAVEFNMTYQELLERENGVYKHIINVRPYQVVDDIQVDVLIAEKSPFRMLSPKPNTKIHVPAFLGDVGYLTNDQLLNRAAATDVEVRSTEQPGGSLAYIYYKQQTARRLAGQIVILFDIERDQAGGTIQTYEGYFLQSIAPSNIPVGNKNVVFVIDKSGSMQGRKIEQVKKAMETILDDLNPLDNFAVILFSKTTQAWTDTLVPAKKQNIDQAKSFIQQSEAKGGTNIYDSINEAITMLKKQDAANPGSSPLSSMVIFLTDGQATVGKKDPNDIVTSIITNNRENQWSQVTKYAIHGIGFGNNADMELLQNIAATNNGIARRVFADSDADVQLEGVFAQLSSPILRNVNIRYVNGDVDLSSLIQPTTQNDVLNSGGEHVVVGKLSASGRRKRAIGGKVVESVVKGESKNGNIQLTQNSDGNDCYNIDESKLSTRPDGSAGPGSRYIQTCNSNTASPAKPTTTTTTTEATTTTNIFSGRSNIFNRFGGSLSSLFGDRAASVFGRGGRKKRQNDPEGGKPDTDRRVGAANSVGGFIERTWAYLTIKKLTKESKEWVRPKAERDQKQEKAIQLSKKYNFVSEFTSMVVVHGVQRSEAVQDEFSADGETANDAAGDNSVVDAGQSVNSRPRDGKCRPGVLLVVDSRSNLLAWHRGSLNQLLSQLNASPFETPEITIFSLDKDGNLFTWETALSPNSDRQKILSTFDKIARKQSCDSCSNGFSALAQYLIGRPNADKFKSFVVLTDAASSLGTTGNTLKGFIMPKVIISADNYFSATKKAEVDEITDDVFNTFQVANVANALKCSY